MNPSNVNILNKRARFEFEILDTYRSGIVLTGTEIKSIRSSKASIREAFCEFNDKGELYIINMNIDHYKNGGYYNHAPKRERKLLLNKRELQKLHKETAIKGNTIVPLKLYIDDRGFAKLQIALAKGKKHFDKRHSIKDRENKISLDRVMKAHKNR